MVSFTLPYRPRRASLLGPFAGLLLLSAALPCESARAEEARPSLTWSQEAFEGEADRLESPELRTLRLAEEELFGERRGSVPEGFDAEAVPGAASDAVTAAPPPSFERDGERVDLSFLKGLKLPSTPVHWDA
ncbi:MAG: hypothetical protein JWN04_16, partial [Myxococcaceae bacterium]|nr:hypothetical protein [Myxococcaceae bacterium]